MTFYYNIHVVVRLLVTEVSCMDVESGKRAIDGRRGTEPHVMAKVVASFLAEGAHTTGYSRLYGNAVTCMQDGN